DLDLKALASALTEAQRRVADAKNAMAMAEAARVAEEVAEIADIIRESGAEADKALKQFVAAANSVSKCIAGLQQRGVNNPNGQQLLSMGRRAVLAAMIESPFRTEFETIAPRERQSFKLFTSAWASAIERSVGAKTKHEEVA